MSHHVMKYPPNKQLIYLVALVLLLAALIGLQSCNSEKKALKPYKEVNSDVDTSFKAKKIELISRVCAINFPMQEKTIIKDSITTKIVRIQDNNLVNKLKSELAKKCKDINIDSIYNELPFDTIYIDHYHTKTVTQKDTISLYNMGVENSRLVYYNQQLKNVIDDNNKDIEKLNKNLKLADKWRIRCFILMALIICYFGIKMFNFVRSYNIPI
jgi:hypothetical protein